MPNTPLPALLRRAAALAAFAATTAGAVELGGVSFHGSVSQTFSYSDEYNFYGDTAGEFSANITEVIVNGTYRWDNGIRAGAQVYGYKLGGFSDVVLDWANVSYQFRPWLGIRAGRNKLPRGLYNDAQDLDQIRVFASLPLAFYPRYLRPITASYDGVGVYGQVSLGGAGSLDYQVYGGRTDDPSADSFFITYFSNWARYTSWDIEGLFYGAWVFWNTPLDGLRVGTSATYLPKATLYGHLDATANLTGGDLGFANSFGPGVWDAYFAGTPFGVNDLKTLFTTFSAEYTFGDFVAAAEIQFVELDGEPYAPAFGQVGGGEEEVQSLLFAYTSLTWQATDKLGLGAYWGYRDDDYTSEPATDGWRQVSHDLCVAASYTIEPWWLVKAEYHYIDGINLAYDTTRGDPLSERTWNYIVLKTTISF